jgi:hypothetical protein
VIALEQGWTIAELNLLTHVDRGSSTGAAVRRAAAEDPRQAAGALDDETLRLSKAVRVLGPPPRLPDGGDRGRRCARAAIAGDRPVFKRVDYLRRRVRVVHALPLLLYEEEDESGRAPRAAR